ncbi:MAG: phosphoribosylformylglycinamidine synthase, partial [Chloroflexi bacterium]|nr:phosphoribosylformylglycinamidine synthase [Chloroflexota bacterium]
MRFGIAVFPGTWSERDCAHAVSLDGHEAVMLWHRDADLRGADCVILPGGFSYGDHLRCGAIARFSPLMDAVAEFAAAGGLVWGICNGFQILCEAHLLPGALLRNASLEFRCEPSWLRVETEAS